MVPLVGYSGGFGSVCNLDSPGTLLCNSWKGVRRLARLTEWWEDTKSTVLLILWGISVLIGVFVLPFIIVPAIVIQSIREKLRQDKVVQQG